MNKKGFIDTRAFEIITLSLLFLPLGVWKAIELILILFSHLQWR